MKFTAAPLKDVWIIDPVRHADARGYFCEVFRKDEFEQAVGRLVDFVQENESFSTCGVVRGLHFQAGDASQAKLVRVSEGCIVDVAVDMRRSSPTFGRYIAVELSSDNGRQLFIPRGFAHGFAVTSDAARFQYKVDNYYCPSAERTLRPDDPFVAVQWPFDLADAILSPKDTAGVTWNAVEKFD